jgi:demethylmenaquinone methyltransferase/2-methoxy-6-polyprenyl-1,4-benzoquinol methylase
MDVDLRQRMLDYYNERAPEYEEAYTIGTGTASIPDPEVFRAEARQLAGMVKSFGSGRLIDLACGTGYWLPFYADRCSQVTLFDQSEKMLNECRKKVDRLGLVERFVLVRGDFFEYDFPSASYDCALVGFFLSHLTESQEPLLFATLRRILGSSGHFLILDSAWSQQRARFNKKVERQERRLNDGTRFEIYKRYIDRSDVLGWASKYDVTMRIEYFGTAFVAVAGHFASGTMSPDA